MLFPALLGLPLAARGVVEVIRFHRAFQLAVHLLGESRIPEPPAPAITGPTMDAQLAGNPPRRTRETEEKRRQNPVHDRALAAIQEPARAVIEGTLTGLLFTAVALQSGLVVVGTPRTDVVALTPRTLEGPIFPAQPYG